MVNRDGGLNENGRRVAPSVRRTKRGAGSYASQRFRARAATPSRPTPRSASDAGSGIALVVATKVPEYVFVIDPFPRIVAWIWAGVRLANCDVKEPPHKENPVGSNTRPPAVSVTLVPKPENGLKVSVKMKGEPANTEQLSPMANAAQLVLATPGPSPSSS